MITFQPSVLDPRSRKYVHKDGERIGVMLRTRTGLYVGQQMWEYRPDEYGKVLTAKTLRQIENLVREAHELPVFSYRAPTELMHVNDGWASCTAQNADVALTELRKKTTVETTQLQVMTERGWNFADRVELRHGGLASPATNAAAENFAAASGSFGRLVKGGR